MARHRLRIIAAVLVAGLASPFAGPADAGSAKGKAKGKTKVSAKSGKGKGRCGGKSYEVHGTLDEGSTLVKVAGAKTKRRSDDRWSGTLIVEVDRGNKRGRAHLGWRAYVVTGVSVQGAGDTLPAAGTRVSLTGKQADAACAATKAWDDEELPEGEGEDEGTGDDAEEAPQPVTGVTIQRVTFKAAKKRGGGSGAGSAAPAPSSDDDPAGDDDGGWTDEGDDDGGWTDEGDDDGSFFGGRR